MLKMTEKLQEWLVANSDVSADASEGDFKKAAADAMVEGTLTSELFVELTKDPAAEAAKSFEAKMDALLDAVKSSTERISALEQAKSEPEKSELQAKEYREAELSEKAPKAAADVAKATADAEPEVNVIQAHKRYDDTKTAATFPTHTAKGMRHPYAGQPVFEGGGVSGRRAINQPSQLDKAISGAYLKYSISSSLGGKNVPRCFRMTDHDNDLLQYALRERAWGGVIGGDCSSQPNAVGVDNEKLSPSLQKYLLDDANSGGLEIAPIAFDDDVIMTPLLNGEIFPMVNTVNITRGRRIEGALLANVTLAASTEGTAITLYSTAGFVTAFDTTIFVVAGAIEIGLDFISDSPVDVASIITQQYGQQLLTWLDTQICTGDGTTEPDGIVGASGVISVAGGSAAPTVGVYESFLFGVVKEYKQGTPTSRIAYAANETTYQRARAIAVGGSDARRVFGMDHESYTLFGHPYAINGSFANTEAVFGNFARYRMYRRLGLSVTATTEGSTLKRSNEMLIVARARFGGQVEDGAAFAVSTTMEA